MAASRIVIRKLRIMPRNTMVIPSTNSSRNTRRKRFSRNASGCPSASVGIGTIPTMIAGRLRRGATSQSAQVADGRPCLDAGGLLDAAQDRLRGRFRGDGTEGGQRHVGGDPVGRYGEHLIPVAIG